MHFALTYLHLLAMSWLAAGAAILALAAFNAVRARFRGPAVLALLSVFLAVPAIAHADGVGSVVLGSVGGPAGLIIAGLFGLASLFHVGDIIVGWVKNAKAPATVIPGHPMATEALDALELAGTHLVQDLVNAHPDLGTVLLGKLKTDSLTNVGAYLMAAYGPELLEDMLKQGKVLLGTEMSLIFGGQKATEQAAINRLGVAASNVVATAKAIKTLPDGAKLVVPA